MKNISRERRRIPEEKAMTSSPGEKSVRADPSPNIREGKCIVSCFQLIWGYLKGRIKR